jgi:hypothetical protein
MYDLAVMSARRTPAVAGPRTRASARRVDSVRWSGALHPDSRGGTCAPKDTATVAGLNYLPGGPSGSSSGPPLDGLVIGERPHPVPADQPVDQRLRRHEGERDTQPRAEPRPLDCRRDGDDDQDGVSDRPAPRPEYALVGRLRQDGPHGGLSR